MCSCALSFSLPATQLQDLTILQVFTHDLSSTSLSSACLSDTYVTIHSVTQFPMSLSLSLERRGEKKNPEKISLLLHGAELDPKTRRNFV